MALPCLLLVAGIGYAIWFWPAGSGGQTARDRDANQPVPVLVATAAQQDVPIYLDGLGTVQAFNTVTIKPMVDGPLLTVNFEEGQEVKKGDAARADRSAHLSGGARSGSRQEGAGRGAACQRAARSGALPKAGRQQLRLHPAGRYGAGAGGPARGAGEAGPGADRHGAHATQLHHDHLADRRPHRHAAGRCRQYRARRDTTGMVVITQLQPISVLFTLPQQTLAQVATAMRQGAAKCWPTRKAPRAARPACWIPARWRCWTIRSIRPRARSS